MGTVRTDCIIRSIACPTILPRRGIKVGIWKMSERRPRLSRKGQISGQTRRGLKSRLSPSQKSVPKLRPNRGCPGPGVAASAAAKSCPKTSTVLAHASESSGSACQSTRAGSRRRWFFVVCVGRPQKTMACPTPASSGSSAPVPCRRPGRGRGPIACRRNRSCESGSRPSPG